MQENNTYNLQTMDKQKRERNAFNISVGTAVMLSLSLLAAYIFTPSPKVDVISLAALSLSILATGISAWLSRHGKSELGIGLILAGLILTIISRVFVTKGLAIPTGITNIILVSAIAFYTLPQKWIGRAVLVSFLVASATIIIDQYTVGIPESTAPQTVTLIALVLGGIYLLVIAFQFKNFPLRTKLIIGFLFLTTLPLIILGWQSNSTIRNILESQIKANILESSLSTSTEFQNFVDSQHSTIRNQARLPEIVEYMTLPQSERPGSQDELAALNKLNSFMKDSPTHILSYALLDKNGINVLDTSSVNIGASYAEQDFFKYVIINKKSYTSGLILTSQPDIQIIYFASPILSKSDEIIGVFVVSYNAKLLQAIMDTIFRGRPLVAIGEYTYLVDGTNFFILGHSSRVNLLFKTYLNLDDARLAALQSQGLISSEDLNSLVIPQPEIVAELSKMKSITAFRAPSQENDGELAEASAIRITNSNWIVVTAQPVNTISTIIQDQTRTTVIISIIITILAALIAVVVSNVFTGPILQLTKVAENISAGDFTQKAEINTKDEIGLLANTFNKMSSQIQELVTGLERRVEQRTTELEQRTTDLEQITKQSEKRADELQTIAEIARYISTEKDLKNLLPLITQTVSEQFGYYHIGIFLLNENRKFAVLRAANSSAGQKMLDRQHKLEVGQVGIVGNVTSTGNPRIALDTGADAIYFNNPDLPETRSEMALPLTARGTIIGALDVQSTVPNAFTDTDVSILGLLADQIAIAIDNARLLDETRNALDETQSIFREYLAGAWQKKSASEIVGYHQTLSGGQLITGKAINEINIPVDAEKDTLAIPIRLRDQVIGTLNIRHNNDDGRTWSADEVNIVQAVAERLGLALDNARLFEETSSRASRERLVSDITTKIRGTNDPQEMIKTAVEELKHALGATRVEVVPKINTVPPDK